MSYGTGTETEFDDVRHGYAPPREQNRAVPAHHAETRAEDVSFGFVDAPFQQSGEVPEGPSPDADVRDELADLEKVGAPRTTAFSDIGDQVNSLLDSGKAAYNAEIRLIKARADVAISAGKEAAIFMAISAAAGLVGMLALGFGAIFILADYLNHTQAVLIVVGALIVVTGLCAWFAKTRFERMVNALWDLRDDE